MLFKKTLSLCLALTMVLGLLAPCGGLLEAKAETVLYGDDLEQVTEPVIGESYYLGANVDGTMRYFLHSTPSETKPYSMRTTDDITHKWAFQLTLESSMADTMAEGESVEGCFQFMYENPSNSNKIARIYCYDVLKDSDTVTGQTGVMDTGINSIAPYKNRHSFFVDTLENGTSVIRKYGNNNILVVKELEYSRSVTDADGNTTTQTGTEWRLLGVDESEIGTEGVYPVMLLSEHSHSFGDAVVDGVTASRSCACGYTQTVYDNKVVSVDAPQIGGSYHLTANVDGTIRYFIHGTVTESSPASLRTSNDLDHSWAFPVVLETPVEGDEGFQMTYTNPSGTDVRIYCYDSIGEDGVVDTGVNAKSELAKHTFKLDQVDGVQVIRKLDNESILVMKEVEYSRSVTDADGNTTTQTGTEWRILGVDESELNNEGVYPVFLTEEHTHIAYGDSYQISDAGHGAVCWCGGYAEAQAHTYGDVTHNDDNTHTHACTVCGYEQVIYGEQYVQVKNPTVGNTYYLAANVAGELLSFIAGGVTETSPYSLKTSSTLATVTVNAALVDGQGDFQLVDASSRYVYSVEAGVGLTTSVNYITYPEKVSFSMDEVNGQSVIRAYGTQNILAAKYSDTKSAWRIFAVAESEIGTDGVYPVVLLDTHEHSYGAWSELSEDHTQTRTCTVCNHMETMWGADDKAILVEEPVIGGSYYLVANVDGTLRYFLHGSPTETVPYSMRTTDDITHKWAFQVTLEDSTATSEQLEGYFQLTYTHPTTGNTARIYCMDVLKDATVDGQTGVMDTGVNSSDPYQNRHSFGVDTLADGTQVLRKYGNNNILVVKELEYSRSVTDADGNTTTETGTEWRLLGVEEDKLASEGVYPVMLANAHTHTFGEELYGDETGHWNLCDCGSKSEIEAHTVDSWTVVTPPSETDSGSKTGVCTVCGLTAVSEMGFAVDSWNIILSDRIGVNFTLALTAGDSVSVTVDGAQVPAALTDNGDGTYDVFVQVAAAQMADEIAITVNGYTLDKTYSVRGYADVILASEEYTSYAKNLVTYMLAYGNAAQLYFDYNTDALAGEDMEISVAMPEAAPQIELYDDLSGVTLKGVSLVLRDKTAVRFYFKAGSIEGLTFTVDGNVCQPVESNGLYCIEIDGINPQELADVINVIVTDGEANLAVQYSPETYMVRMYHNSDSETLKALVEAMYGYYSAAKTYMANLNLEDDFAQQTVSRSSLYEGVELYEKVYVADGYGEVEAYVLTVAADAKVALKVSAGNWEETDSGAKTVAKHFSCVEDAGYEVLAMINGGFFDLNNAGTYLPYGVQIVDGVVIQAPSADRNSYSNNWFGMTTAGKYVISDAAGYESTYVGNVQQAVGGGKLLMIDGVSQELTSDRAFRTAVGVNANGDLVMVCVENATYSDVCHIFVDMGMDITTVLNLDGGGSTAMYVPGTYYPKALILGDDGLFARKVADAVAIVVEE